MRRRDALQGLGAAFAAGLLGGLPARTLAQAGPSSPLLGPRNLLAAPWAAWKDAYLSEDGRVVDARQQGASHSESQGYGLYLAALFGDDDAFDSIHAWTEANLAIRSDALLAWRWLPEDAGQVTDRNNAADGDLFYAWGLVTRAKRADPSGALMDRARAIAADLVASCVVAAPGTDGRLALLPAAQGFADKDRIIVNPSYYMPRAMREIAAATGQSALATCAADGTAMITGLARSALVPDWIELGPQGMFPPVGRPDVNGYEAMRVPLFMIWSGNVGNPAIAAEARAYRAADLDESGTFVTVFDRKTGAIDETSRHVGYGALAALVTCTASGENGSTMPFYRTRGQAYYPATLHLMAMIAQIMAVPECVPI